MHEKWYSNATIVTQMKTTSWCSSITYTQPLYDHLPGLPGLASCPQRPPTNLHILLEWYAFTDLMALLTHDQQCQHSECICTSIKLTKLTDKTRIRYDTNTLSAVNDDHYCLYSSEDNIIKTLQQYCDVQVVQHSEQPTRYNSSSAARNQPKRYSSSSAARNQVHFIILHSSSSHHCFSIGSTNSALQHQWHFPTTITTLLNPTVTTVD